MREQGVIVRDIAVVEPRAVGRPTFFVVSLEIERERPELIAQLREWIARHAEIQQAFYVTGETDFVLIITARDTEAFDTMMSRLVKENPNVRRFTTNVVLGLLKQGLIAGRARAARFRHPRALEDRSPQPRHIPHQEGTCRARAAHRRGRGKQSPGHGPAVRQGAGHARGAAATIVLDNHCH